MAVPPTPHEELEPASPGSLKPDVARDVALLRQFTLGRERAMARLFARKSRISPARDELIRLIVLAFSEGKSFRTTYYQEACLYFAARNAVSQELTFLGSCGLILFQPDPRYKRATLVVPTRKLIEFYNHHMPSLRREVLASLGLDETDT